MQITLVSKNDCVLAKTRIPFEILPVPGASQEIYF